MLESPTKCVLTFMCPFVFVLMLFTVPVACRREPLAALDASTARSLKSDTTSLSVKLRDCGCGVRLPAAPVNCYLGGVLFGRRWQCRRTFSLLAHGNTSRYNVVM